MEFMAIALVVGLILYIEKKIYSKNIYKNLTYDCKFSVTEAYEGDEILLVETVSNQKWLPVPWFKAELNTSKYLEFAGSQSVITGEHRFVPSFFMLKKNQRVQRTWKVKCLKRGIFDLSVALVATDLLGNVNAGEAFEKKISITILPGQVQTNELLITANHMMGDIVVKRHLIPDPFYISGVREYTERDSVNKIHWAATAKVGKIMVFNNDYTAQQSVCVILNMQSREFENSEVIDKDQMEDSIRVCAKIFDDCLKQGFPISFLSNASVNTEREIITTNSYWGNTHVHDLMLILSNLVLKSTEFFSVFLKDIYDDIKATDIIIVTAYIDEDIFEFVRMKRKVGIHVKVVVTNYFDIKKVPSDCNVYTIAQDEEAV